MVKSKEIPKEVCAQSGIPAIFALLDRYEGEKKLIFNQYNFYITREPKTSRFQRRKFSVPFGITFCVGKYKYSIESVQSFHFGFYEIDGCNIFLFFFDKNPRKKIIQSIRNVNAYPNKSNG